MSSQRPELESAINEHSCALACLVSLLRSHGVSATQEEIISAYLPTMPQWVEKPGLLTGNEMIQFCRLHLDSKTHEWSLEKNRIIELALGERTLGGFVITKRYWDENGVLADYNHCKRILGVSGDGIQLMNPWRDHQADIVIWKWDVLDLWKASALFLLR